MTNSLKVMQKTTSLLFALILFCFMTPSVALAFTGTGAGTSDNPYRITTCAQLMEIDDALSSSYILTNDIDCAGTSIEPMGAGGSRFTGTLDGQNHAITNFVIPSSSNDVAMFEVIGTNATLRNIRLESGSVTRSTTSGTASSFATLVAANSTNVTLTNVSSKLTLSGGSTIGGLIGGAYGDVTISKSFYSGSITTGDNYAGGLIGWTLGDTRIYRITDSYATGSISSTASYTGGIVGYMDNDTTILRTYSAVNISLSTGHPTYAGGLVGFANGPVSNSFSASTIAGSATYKGAMFGYATNVSNVYFDSTKAPLACEGYGNSITCQAITGQPNYFLNTTMNPPLNTWDFNNVWYTSSGAYPTLYGFGRSVPPAGDGSRSSLLGSTTAAPSCSAARPVGAPNLFQVDAQATSADLHFSPVDGTADKYFITYGTTSGQMQYGVEWSQSKPDGAITFPIHHLAPNTTYYFRVRAGNECMPGDWSQERSITTQ